MKFPMKTRKALFLNDMDQFIAWAALVELIEPYYLKFQGAAADWYRADVANLFLAALV